MDRPSGLHINKSGLSSSNATAKAFEQVPGQEAYTQTEPSYIPVPHETDTTAEWTVISESVTAHDEQIIADWKDDLNSLLVFSGLFSSVLTGFGVDSYKWLQPSDPTSSTQIQLLSQISTQLASFSLAPGFANSTSQPAPLSQVDSAPEPSNRDIRINTLWFLSLGLSLISSLFAIMVQQWLREYRVPGYLTPRERVRLRQYRYDGLLDWKVPQIVSILPVLLQIALILFLSGLCDLLFSLEQTVARVFIAFVGVALAAYSAFVVLPIAFRRCPYKNPIAHASSYALHVTVQTLLAMAGIILGVWNVVAVIPLFWKENSTTARMTGIRDRTSTLYLRFCRVGSMIVNRSLLRTYGSSRPEYWTMRELLVLPEIKDKLDQDALAWAPSAVTNKNLAVLSLCLQDLDTDQQIGCVLTWTAQALNIDVESYMYGVHTGRSPFIPRTIEKMDGTFARRFQDVLLHVLPYEISQGSGNALGTLQPPNVLFMLRHIARTYPADPDFVRRYTQGVIAACGGEISDRKRESIQEQHYYYNGWIRLPTLCLFECSTILRYEFTDQQISWLFDRARQLYSTLLPTDRLGYVVFVVEAIALEPVLVSIATALYALSRRPSLLLQTEGDDRRDDLLTKFRGTLDDMNHVLVTEKAGIRRLGQHSVDGIVAADGILMCAASAVITLCKSVVALADAGLLSDVLDEQVGALTLPSLVDRMIKAFEGEPAFAEGVEILVRYRDQSIIGSTAIVGDPIEAGGRDAGSAPSVEGGTGGSDRGQPDPRSIDEKKAGDGGTSVVEIPKESDVDDPH